jgi:hypothetical protein
MCLTSNGAHLSDIFFKKWLENVMLFHVAYHCLAGFDLIFNWSVHFQVINRLNCFCPTLYISDNAYTYSDFLTVGAGEPATNFRKWIGDGDEKV